MYSAKMISSDNSINDNCKQIWLLMKNINLFNNINKNVIVYSILIASKKVIILFVIDIIMKLIRNTNHFIYLLQND